MKTNIIASYEQLVFIAKIIICMVMLINIHNTLSDGKFNFFF